EVIEPGCADLRSQPLLLDASADDAASDLTAAVAHESYCLDQDIEAFFLDQSADGQDLAIHACGSRPDKAFQIKPIVNAHQPVGILAKASAQVGEVVVRYGHVGAGIAQLGRKVNRFCIVVENILGVSGQAVADAGQACRQPRHGCCRGGEMGMQVVNAAFVAC